MARDSSDLDLRAAGPGAVVAQRYLVRREIARGGVGSISEAHHAVTGARVALKTRNRPSLDSASARARLLREARVLGLMRHPGVVAVHDAVTCERHGPFVALEMLEGRPFDGVLLARGTLSIAQTVALAHALCTALAYVHRHGVVHRDVKPANVLVARAPFGDRIELVDFGIACIERATEGGL